MEGIPVLNGRQLWANPSPTPEIPKECRPIRLPSGGQLNVGNDTIITLDQDAVYQPVCADYPSLNVTSTGFNISVIDDKDPFYASTLPQIYAIATATIVSYMLLIILFITPRTFFVGGAGGGNGFLGRRGMISGASGSTSVIGIGGRPWLQKVAALTVAVSLTIATVDTLRVAEDQYEAGYQDVTLLTDKVQDDLQIRVVRIISDTCLWLAQAQTLIRLFPRHKEKVIIKWTAFALILLDLIFSILNSFVYGNVRARPRTFVDTVPALNYLFAIALSILYMAWVLYYSISKRRFAFYHPKMRNICLMAILSLTTILIPVVFFVLDIASPRVNGWGNYVRWVGAAAASVVVWEWVERIEALERDENKDGILGREIFDGDEMLRDTPSSELDRQAGSRGNHQNTGHPRRGSSGDDDGGPAGATLTTRAGINSAWEGVAAIATQLGQKGISRHQRSPQKQNPRDNRIRGRKLHTLTSGRPADGAYDRNIIIPPPMTDSPVSRADTTSAASTIERAHYHPVSEFTPPIPEAFEGSDSHAGIIASATSSNDQSSTDTTKPQEDQTRLYPPSRSHGLAHSWRRMPTLFKRQCTSPPPEVSQAIATFPRATSDTENSVVRSESKSTSSRLEQMWRKRKLKNEEIPLPVTIIPWQPRGRAYLDRVDADFRLSSGQIQPVTHAGALTVREQDRSPSGSELPQNNPSSVPCENNTMSSATVQEQAPHAAEASSGTNQVSVEIQHVISPSTDGSDVAHGLRD